VARRHAGDPMGVGEAVIVAGIGCRKGASSAEIEAAIEAALAQAGCSGGAVGLIATSDGKGGEAGIVQAARMRGVKLVLVGPADLEAAAPCTQSSSPRVRALTGVPSVAEAAALAAAGPDARLLLPRIVVGPATCALAETGMPTP
jgi:cobalt-precorrin 5A hydrolase